MNNPTPKNKPDQFVLFNYPVIAKQMLNRTFDEKRKDFLDVVISRRSITGFSEIESIEIEELLYYSNKIQSFHLDDSGFITTKRIAPSGGARHPIDLLVSLPQSISNRSLIYYNPLDHSFNELSIPSVSLQSFFNEVNQNIAIENACIIWFSIQPSKTGSKYLNPESLYWRDTGIMLYCIQLIATFLGYKSCPLGTLAANSFNSLFDTPHLLSGGGILIGK